MEFLIDKRFGRFLQVGFPFLAKSNLRKRSLNSCLHDPFRPAQQHWLDAPIAG